MVEEPSESVVVATTVSSAVAGATVVADLSEEELETENESERVVSEFLEEDVGSPEEAETVSVGALDNLEACIEAVGLELEDKVLTGLLEEINGLDEQWSDQPLEKTFLHLLRTVGQHIDSYRYEAGSAAYSLLKSVFDALALSQTTIERKNELLLAQTVRVLDWQQDIIKNDARKSVDSAKMSEPLFVQELGSPEDQMLTFEDDMVNEFENDTSAGTESGTPVNLKDEISNLRKSLQDEISELKKG